MTDLRVDVHRVADALSELGVGAGDLVALHSRVPALGRIVVDIFKQGGEPAVERAANDIVEGFLAAVGPKRGALCVPTFTYCFAGPEDATPYNPATTPSKVGMLTDLFFRRPDAVRSLSPTHSVAAIGARAEELVRDHNVSSPLGPGTPFHRLAEWGGWICYLGTNGNTLSLLHVAEAIAGVPYVDVFRYSHVGWRSAALIERPDGSVEEVPVAQAPGCSKHFHRFDALAEEAGIMRESRIYNARVVLFRAMDALEIAVEKLREAPGFFLCPQGECQTCDAAWEALA